MHDDHDDRDHDHDDDDDDDNDVVHMSLTIGYDVHMNLSR